MRGVRLEKRKRRVDERDRGPNERQRQNEI